MRKSTIGRLAVYHLYGALIIYLCYTVLGGMLKTLYENPTSPPTQQTATPFFADHEDPCLRRMTRLQGDLRERTIESLHLYSTNEIERLRWKKWYQTQSTPPLMAAVDICSADRSTKLGMGYDLLRQQIEQTNNLLKAVAKQGIQHRPETRPLLK